jgi:hypothetical protein
MLSCTNLSLYKVNLSTFPHIITELQCFSFESYIKYPKYLTQSHAVYYIPSIFVVNNFHEYLLLFFIKRYFKKMHFQVKQPERKTAQFFTLDFFVGKFTEKKMPNLCLCPRHFFVQVLLVLCFFALYFSALCFFALCFSVL